MPRSGFQVVVFEEPQAEAGLKRRVLVVASILVPPSVKCQRSADHYKMTEGLKIDRKFLLQSNPAMYSERIVRIVHSC